MSIPSSVEELLNLIRKSGMIEEPRLNAYLERRQLGRGALSADAREAADQMVKDGLITYFQAEQFLLGKWRGFTIGKYKLLERVGVGGMGQVFLCEHMYMKRLMALKVLPPAKAEQPAALGRFYREARAAGSLEHENIVRTLDIDQDGNLHYIVMEYVCGSNLLDVGRKFGPLDLGRAVSYVHQVANGLEYAFRSGIIHRDVKPGNILITRDGVAKVLDMGLARFYTDQTDQLTVKYDDKIVLGTADYVAPEQVANSHEVDIRADIYALGASLYFLLAGHPPFPQGTVSQKLVWHRTKDPTPVRQIRPEVPEGIAAIVARMMAKNPADRYQTPADVMRDLARWLPVVVPLPAAEEMPQLSPAAMEAVGVQNPPDAALKAAEAHAPVGAGVVSEHDEPPRSTLRRKPTSHGDSPFVPTRSGATASPLAPASPMQEAPRAGKLSPSPFAPPSKTPSRPSFSLGSQADVATDAMQAQHSTPPPAPAPLPRRETVSPAPAPAAAARFDLKTVALIAAVLGCTVLTAGLVYMKFGG